jgi:hypothetical protein
MSIESSENFPHAYRDSFDNGCCERSECGRPWDDSIHWDRFHHLRRVAAYLRSCALSGETPTDEGELRAALGKDEE